MDTPKAGHNNPPKKLELREQIKVLETEIENWLDGTRVENDGQMAAVDFLIKQAKDLNSQIKHEKEIEFRPHKDAADAVTAEFKVDIDTLDGWLKGLITIVGDYKIEQKRQKDEIARAAADVARDAEREAQARQAATDYSDLAQRREADEMALAARKLKMDAQYAKQDKVAGLRTTKRAVVTDYKTVINHIALNDRPAIMAFCDDWIRAKYRADGYVPDGAEIIAETKAI